MSNLTLKAIFYKYYNTLVTKSTIVQFNSYLRSFELRDEHPLMLNSPYLGINRLVFSPTDRSNIYSIFNIDDVELKSNLENIASYNKNFETISDEYNILSMWLVHKALTINTSNISKSLLMEFAKNILVMLYYKLMSSRLFRIFKHTPNEDVMRYTIESLNYRFDIVKYGTWKKLIYIKCEELLEKNSIHYPSFIKFEPDDKVYYIISDIKTKINSTIQSISELYYENFNTSKTIESYDATNTIDGEKILKDSNYVYDSIICHVQNQILNDRVFINERYVQAISDILTSISYPILYKFLVYICNTAKDQKRTNSLQKDINKKEFIFYQGIHLLLYKLISFTFKEIIKRGVNINNKLAIFQAVKSLYSSSKYTNPEFLNIRESIKEHIVQSKLTNRLTTINGLVTGFVLYIFLKIFEIMK